MWSVDYDIRYLRSRKLSDPLICRPRIFPPKIYPDRVIGFPENKVHLKTTDRVNDPCSIEMYSILYLFDDITVLICFPVCHAYFNFFLCFNQQVL